jgi:hypothetical protein
MLGILGRAWLTAVLALALLLSPLPTQVSVASAQVMTTPSEPGANFDVLAQVEPSETPDLQIAPELGEAWNAMISIQREILPGKPLGPVLGGIAIRTGVPMVTAPLPAEVLGGYNQVEKVIRLNTSILDEDPRAIATVLAHELTHAQQDWEGRSIQDQCVVLEQEAFANGAVVWSELWNGAPPSRTALETELTRMALLWVTEGDPGIYKLVVDEPGYQRQCNLIVPQNQPVASQSAPAPKPAPTIDQALASRCFRDAHDFVPATQIKWDDPNAVGRQVLEICRQLAIRHSVGGVECFEWSFRNLAAELRRMDGRIAAGPLFKKGADRAEACARQH